MANAEHKEILNVDKEKLFDAITRYEDYPQFVEGVKAVKVERKGEGAARATYSVSMMKDFVYTLDHKEDRAKGRVEWTLVSSDAFKVNKGYWQLKDAGKGKTDVTYAIEVDFTFPVPGFILNKVVKGTLPSMVQGFARRAGAKK